MESRNCYPCRNFLYFVFTTTCLPFVHSIASLPDIQGWHMDTLHVMQNIRLELRETDRLQDQQQDDDGMFVTMTTPNIQQCLRMCWLYSTCRIVAYSIGDSGPSYCRLFGLKYYKYVTKVPDTSAIVVNMTDAVMKKTKLLGCDQRPCQNNELCAPVRSYDMYKCLPLASRRCGAPPFKVDNATSTTDGLGYAHVKCNEGFASIPEGGVTLECNKVTGQWSAMSLTCQYVDCKIPPSLEGAHVRYTDTDFGAVSTYSCYPGYYSSSESKMQVQCQRSGIWTELPSPCRLVDCGQPLAIDNGRVQLIESLTMNRKRRGIVDGDSGTRYGSMATHSCLKGYVSPITSVESTCQSNGQWSNLLASFQCKPIDCGQPPSFDLTTKTFATTAYMSNVSYACVDGYKNTANVPGNDDEVIVSSQCQHDGSWSWVNVTCKPINCGNPREFHGINVTANSSTYGSIAYLKCSNTSHLFKGRNQIVCNASGLWSHSNASCIGPPCTTPENVANSYVTVEMAEDKYIAVYRSQPGFVFETGEISEFRTCINGTWTGHPDLQSVPVTCGPPPQVPNADLISTTGYTYPSKATYACRKGFGNTTGISHVNCLESGSWSEVTFACTKITCIDPPPVIHSKNNLSQTYDYGDKIVYECQEGFSLKTPNDTVACTDTGWETIEVECVRTECGSPPIVPNSTYVIDQEYVVYVCQNTFVLRDASMSNKTCRGGMWSTEEVVCDYDGCPEPPDVENAMPILNATTRDSVVIYVCENGFQLTSGAAHQRRCLANRAWSAENVTCDQIKCGTAPAIANTNVSYTMNDVLGSVVSYRCNTGFELPVDPKDSNIISTRVMFEVPVFRIPTGDTAVDNTAVTNTVIWTATCNKYGQWASDEIRPDLCTPVTCGNPPRIENAQARQPYNKTFGTVIEYTCAEGYRLVATGFNNKTCEASRTWKGFVQCKIIECPNYVQPISNATMQTEGVKPGDTVVYICDEGYSHWWFDRKVCLENGTWSRPQIQCQIIDCGTPPALEHALITYEGTTYQSTASYMCQAPYVNLNKINKKKCLEYGWSDINLKCVQKSTIYCPNLDNPFGEISYTNLTENGLAVFGACDEGYRLETTTEYTGHRSLRESTTRICRGGQWTGQDILCRPIDCGTHPSIQNAVAIVTKQTYQSQVVYECKLGYVMAGPNNKTCMADGHWSNDIVECVQRDVLYCPPAANINRAAFYYNSHIVGSKGNYTCQDGYIKNGREVECLPTGNWPSLEDFNCIPVDCRSPPPMENTRLHVRETSFGHHAIYTCSFYSRDSEHRPSRSQCQTNGTWSKIESPCLHCSSPPKLPNTVDYAGTKQLYDIGEIVTYNCPDGFTPYPYDAVQMECGQGGHWSSIESQSYCIPEICTYISSLDPKYTVHVDYVDTNNSQMVAHYHCKHGHYIKDHAHTDRAPILCDFTAGWLTDNLFPCLPVDCGTPSAISNAFALVNGTTYEWEVPYYCETAYTPSGSKTTSVCQHNGTWSPVDLKCFLCSIDILFANGRLIEKDNSGENDASEEQATVECAENYLLYSSVGPVNPVVTCVEGTTGNQWGYLENLACVKNTWRHPRNIEDIRLDHSYSRYIISFEAFINEMGIVAFSFIAKDGLSAVTSTASRDEATAFELLVARYEHRITFVQTSSDGVIYSDPPYEDVAFKEGTNVHRFSVEVTVDKRTYYKVWVDSTYVGEMIAIVTPVSAIRIFQYDGNGDDFQVQNLSIKPSED